MISLQYAVAGIKDVWDTGFGNFNKGDPADEFNNAGAELVFRRLKAGVKVGSRAKKADIVDAIVELTETGSSLRAAGMKIIDTILVSYTELVANPASFADPTKRHAMQQIMTLLTGTRTRWTSSTATTSTTTTPTTCSGG